MSAKFVIEPNAIYTRQEAAQVLGVSLSTLKHLIRAGHLVVSQPAGLRRVFIKGSNILEMLEQTTRDPQQGSEQAVEHSRIFTNGNPASSSRAPRLGSEPDESWRPSRRADKLALRTRRAIKRSPTLSRRASGKKFARAQGGSTG